MRVNPESRANPVTKANPAMTVNPTRSAAPGPAPPAESPMASRRVMAALEGRDRSWPRSPGRQARRHRPIRRAIREERLMGLGIRRGRLKGWHPTPGLLIIHDVVVKISGLDDVPAAVSAPVRVCGAIGVAIVVRAPVAPGISGVRVSAVARGRTVRYRMDAGTRPRPGFRPAAEAPRLLLGPRRRCWLRGRGILSCCRYRS